MSLFFKFVTQRLRAVATLVCVCGGGGGGGGGGDGVQQHEQFQVDFQVILRA
jgi:hypothetical protein